MIDSYGTVLFQERSLIAGVEPFQLINFLGQFYNFLTRLVLPFFQREDLFFKFFILPLQKLKFVLLPGEIGQVLFLSHLGALEFLFDLFEFLLEFVEQEVVMAFELQRDELLWLGLIDDHQSDLSFHHAYDFIDWVELVLAMGLVAIVEVGSPDVA